MAGCAVIVAGFGFRAAATVASLTDAFCKADGPGRAGALATAADKADTAPFRLFAQTVALPTHRIDASTLTRQDTVTRSNPAYIARGTGSVAEAAALAAAGPGAQLLAPRVISRDGLATCALAHRMDTP